MQTWTFLRHGESVANAQGVLCGLVNSPLSPLGVSQARAIAAPAGLDLCLCSDLLRAVQTAQILTRGELPIQMHPQLRERNMGQWAGRDKAALRASGAFEAMRRWQGAPEGGESYQTLHQRLLPFLAQLPTREHSRVLLVAHGGVIRVLLAQVDGLLAQATGRQSVPNAAPIVREIPADFWARAAALMES